MGTGNNYLVDVEHRDWGPSTLVGRPVSYSGTPNAPVEGSLVHWSYVGEQTMQALTEMAGYGQAEAEELMRKGAAPHGVGGHELPPHKL